VLVLRESCSIFDWVETNVVVRTLYVCEFNVLTNR
jgi:hypothetical protein